ncbi:uncharacterized protein [Amphiura filiformis]|uniref:uncharacterized protein n=1 Tax=Amphiura filiformis TaxID=82378 RepID=UPI003B2130BD
MSLRLFVIYRPPRNDENKLTSSMFLEEFSSLLESLTVLPGKLLMTGYFNVHVDNEEDREAFLFSNLLQSFGLCQHITGPTHKKGHTLHLIISRDEDDIVTSPSVYWDMPSDHAAVKCYVNIFKPGPSIKRVESRRLRDIDSETFIKGIQTSGLLQSSASDSETLVEQYNTTLLDILNQHAPLVKRSVVLRPHAPWYSDALRAAKQEKRRRERKWRKTDLTVYKQCYLDQCEHYRDLLNEAKTSYHRSQVEDTDQRNLFRVIDKLSKPKVKQVLPLHESPKKLANNFAMFFNDKVKKLRAGLENKIFTPVSIMIDEKCSSSFSEFELVSEDDVLKVMKSSSVTSCGLDPLPSKVFKMCMGELVPITTRIVNTSLSSGNMPETLKHANIVPLLKKPGLDRDEFANYRPISNLSFLSNAPLQDIINAHGISNVVYADDTQLYLTFEPEECDAVLKKMEACISDIKSWCSSNKLVLNDKKTELLHFSSQFKKSTLHPTLTIGDSVITPSPRARNLGVIMDSSLRMSKHVDSVCKSALFAIRKIG